MFDLYTSFGLLSEVSMQLIDKIPLSILEPVHLPIVRNTRRSNAFYSNARRVSQPSTSLEVPRSSQDSTSRQALVQNSSCRAYHHLAKDIRISFPPSGKLRCHRQKAGLQLRRRVTMCILELARCSYPLEVFFSGSNLKVILSYSQVHLRISNHGETLLGVYQMATILHSDVLK